MKTRSGILKWIDPILLIGLLTSVTVAIGMVLLGNDSLQSLTVGLMVTIITLLVDIIARVQKTESSVLEATKFSQIASDENIGSSLLRIAQYYKSMQIYNFDIYNKIAKDKLIEIEGFLRDMSYGSVMIPSRSIYDYTRKGMLEAKLHIRVISREADIPYWKSDRGMQYLLFNKEVIQKGIKFTRIFAMDYSIALQNMDILRQQENAGVRVFVVSPEKAWKEIMIFDHNVLLIYKDDPETQVRMETIVLDIVKVRREVEEFDNLIQLGRSMADLENLSQ